MNKKADIEISLKTLIGFILVIIILMAFIGFFAKLWGMFLNKPNQATTNSFKNLVYEINTLEEDQGKEVPFFIQKGLYLKTECEKSITEVDLKGSQILNDICICAHECSKKRHIRDIITWIKKDGSQSVKIEGGSVTYNKEAKVRNLKLARNDKGIVISIIA